MQVKAEYSYDGKTLLIKDSSGGMVFITDDWPSRQLDIDHFLSAILGKPRDGWYAYHEPSLEWLTQVLELLQSQSPDFFFAMGVKDMARVDDMAVSPSVVVGASVAVQELVRRFNVDAESAGILVRLNVQMPEGRYG